MAAEGAEPGGGDGATAQALLLLLQHEAGRNQSVVCKLLATSNATRSTVDSHCSGQLAVAFDCASPRVSHSAQEAKRISFRAWLLKRHSGGATPRVSHSAQEAKESSFKAWLLKHSGLLRALRVEGYGNHLHSASVLGALSQAVKLESFGSSWDDDTSAKVLNALPATLLDLQVVLTELEPDWGEGFDSIPMSEEEREEFEAHIMIEQMEAMQYIRNKHDNPAMVQALQRFTRLRSLHIAGDVSLRSDSPVMKGLSGLTALTRLRVSSVLSGLEQLRHLPTQLRELELKDTLRHSRRMTFASFSHLTALTRLHTDAGVVVVESDVLPPNLVRLCVQQCESLKPLLPLKSLRQLTLGRDTTDKQLQHVQHSLPEVDVRTVSKTAKRNKDCHCVLAEAVQA